MMTGKLMMSESLRDIVSSDMLHESDDGFNTKFSYAIAGEKKEYDCEIKAMAVDANQFKITLNVPPTIALEFITSFKKIDPKSCGVSLSDDKRLIPPGMLISASAEKSPVGEMLLSLMINLIHVA